MQHEHTLLLNLSFATSKMIGHGSSEELFEGENDEVIQNKVLT